MLETEEKLTKDLPKVDMMAAFSDKTQSLLDALKVLYIRYNASGRNIFRNKWPEVAEYLFGEELIKYDYEGTNDHERRSELELAAGERRIELKATIAEIVEKSVDKGVLQFDYVGQIIDKYGASISRYLYAEDVIERVRPGILAKYKGDIEAKEDSKQKAQDVLDEEISAKAGNQADLPSLDQNIAEESEFEQKLSVEEKEILSNIDDDYTSKEVVVVQGHNKNDTQSVTIPSPSTLVTTTTASSLTPPKLAQQENVIQVSLGQDIKKDMGENKANPLEEKIVPPEVFSALSKSDSDNIGSLDNYETKQ